MSDRNWFPVPAPFVSMNEPAAVTAPVPVIPYVPGAPAPVTRPITLPVDRSPVPLITVLATLQGEFHGTNRMLERELRRPFPDADRVKEYRQDMVRIRGERESLLDALMWHEQTWAHLADDCVICNRTVGHNR